MFTTSIAAFATDFHDEGIDVALGRIHDRGGITGVTLAAVYHHGRDIFPHNPVRKVRFLEGGRTFFRPDQSLYTATPIHPIESSLATEWDALAELRRATGARGMSLHAWTVFNHNSLLGFAHPDATIVNVFGDPQLTYLCPANPDVIEYCSALAADIARYQVESIVAESMHFHPLEHGYHHERYLIDIGPIERFLLGLCFCTYCQARGAQHGVAIELLRGAILNRLETFFASATAYDSSTDNPANIGQLWDGELLAYVRSREAAVADLAAAVQYRLSGLGTRFTFMDAAGAIKGYDDGMPTGEPAPEVSWKIGVDPSLIAPFCDDFLAVGYAVDPDRIAADLAAYRSLTGKRCGLRVALRPMAPDCNDESNLARKLVIAADAGAETVDFYHYGFARLETLDLVRAASDAAELTISTRGRRYEI